MISEAFFYKEEQNEFLQNRKVSRNLTKNIEVFLKLTFLYFGRERKNDRTVYNTTVAFIFLCVLFSWVDF